VNIFKTRRKDKHSDEVIPHPDPEERTSEVIPYRDPEERTSITTPALIGYQASGEPYRLRLDRHWADVGITRSGMGSLIHTKFAHITNSTDALLWAGRSG
jgi:hypothetical protein